MSAWISAPSKSLNGCTRPPMRAASSVARASVRLVINKAAPCTCSERAAKSGLANAGAKTAGVGLSALFGIDPNLSVAATGGVANLTMLKFSRDDETEADVVGLDIVARAGYDPRAGVALWQKMAMLSKNAPPQ